MSDVAELKRIMRRTLRTQLAALAADRWVSGGSRACKRALDLAAVAQARHVMLSWPMLKEPELLTLAASLAARGVVLAVPRCGAGSEMNAAVMDIGPPDGARFREAFQGSGTLRETPASWPALAVSRLDVVVVPGLGFDHSGQRLGRGAGFYDRFLARPELRAFKVGIALDEQLVDKVPMESHDVPLDAVVTDSAVFPA